MHRCHCKRFQLHLIRNNQVIMFVSEWIRKIFEGGARQTFSSTFLFQKIGSVRESWTAFETDGTMVTFVFLGAPGCGLEDGVEENPIRRLRKRMWKSHLGDLILVRNLKLSSCAWYTRTVMCYEGHCVCVCGGPASVHLLASWVMLLGESKSSKRTIAEAVEFTPLKFWCIS